MCATIAFVIVKERRSGAKIVFHSLWISLGEAIYNQGDEHLIIVPLH